MESTFKIDKTVTFRYNNRRGVQCKVIGFDSKLMWGEMLSDYKGKNNEWFAGEKKTFIIKKMSHIVQ